MDDQQYSLWLMPELRCAQSLKRIIRDLGIKYSAPVFEPHVTLLSRVGIPGNIEVPLMDIIKGFKEMSLRVSGLGCEPSFYRSLYAEIETKFELLELHKKACELFNVFDSVQFKPHLSLFYGRLQDDIKTAIIHELKPELPKVIEINRLQLWNTSGDCKYWSIFSHSIRHKLNIAEAQLCKCSR